MNMLRLLEDDTSLSAAENSAAMLDTLLSEAQWPRDSHATRQEIESSKDSARERRRQRDREREERLKTESERGREFGRDGFERRTSPHAMSRNDCHLPRSQLGFRSPTAERPLPTVCFEPRLYVCGCCACVLACVFVLLPVSVHTCTKHDHGKLQSWCHLCQRLPYATCSILRPRLRKQRMRVSSRYRSHYWT